MPPFEAVTPGINGCEGARWGFRRCACASAVCPGRLGAVDEDFVVDDRGVEGRDEFEKVSLAFDEVGEKIGVVGGQAWSWSGSVCLASSSWLSAQRGSRFMNISRPA